MRVGMTSQFVGGGGAPLPYDEQLEWIEANGNQYINTGVMATYNTFASCHAQFVSMSSDSVLFCADAGATSSNGFGICHYPHAAVGLYANFDNYDWAYMKFGDFYDTENFHYFSLNNSRFYLDDQYREVNGSSFSTNYDIPIFGWRRPGSVGGCGHTRMTDIIIGDASITRDLIPVLKNAVPCMYDRNSGDFLYNAVDGHQLGYKRTNGEIVDPY